MLATLSEACREKLAARRDHGDWRERDASWLMAWLQTEVRELRDALADHADALDGIPSTERRAETRAAVRAECADVANLAGMILDTIERAPMREGTEEGER
jgi:NTP pyrophosphatase (non-canonical NTP hydrolase)